MSYPSGSQWAYARASERDTMRATCVITRRVETNTGGDVSIGTTTLYSGPCTLFGMGNWPGLRDVGERDMTVEVYTLKLPFDAPLCQPGDIATVSHDGLTVKYAVVGDAAKTAQTRRRVLVQRELP